MMFEDCRSLALDKTNLFLLAFLHATGLELTKKGIAILIKETKIKTSLLSLTAEPGNKSLVRSIYIFFIIRENKKGNKRWARFNSNLDFDNCSHEYPELSVYWEILAGKLNMPKKVLSVKKMPILFLINSFTWLFLDWRLQKFQTVRLGCISSEHETCSLIHGMKIFDI